MMPGGGSSGRLDAWGSGARGALRCPEPALVPCQGGPSSGPGQAPGEGWAPSYPIQDAKQSF